MRRRPAPERAALRRQIMSMKAMLLAAATAATLLAPAAAMAQDYGHDRYHDGRDGRQMESRWSRDDHRDRRSYGYAYNGAYPAYDYGYTSSYPAYGYGDAYRYARPAWRDRDHRRDGGRDWDRDRDHGRHYRPY
jgi:hypothetical protein